MKSERVLPGTNVPEIELVPTFHCISYYFNFATPQTQYPDPTPLYQLANQVPAANRNPGMPPEYEAVVDEASGITFYQFRGSFANLQPDTEYNISLKLSGVLEPVATVRTYADTQTLYNNQKIVEIDITSYLITNKIGYLFINGLTRTDDMWYKLVVPPGFSVGHTGSLQKITITNNGTNNPQVSSSIMQNPDQIFAVDITASNRVILDGFEVIGGYKDGIIVHSSSSPVVKSHSIRLSNLEIHKFGERGQILPNGKNAKPNGTDAVGSNGIHLVDASNIVIERCNIHDPLGTTNPWRGETWQSSEPYGMCGIQVSRGNNIVVRYNCIVGSRRHSLSDGINGYQNLTPTGGLATDSDIYGNFIFGGEDDGIEVDGGQRNVRVWYNRVEGYISALSHQGTMIGPAIVFRNVFANMADTFGYANEVVKLGARSGFKKAYHFNNTVYSKVSVLEWVSATATGTVMISRNNIFVSTKASPVLNNSNDKDPVIPGFDMDFDILYNTQDPVALFMYPTRQEQNRLVADPPTIPEAEPIFVNEAGQNFSLVPNTIGYEMGQTVRNIIQARGNHSELGAFEGGSFLEAPSREINVIADKYHLAVNENDSHVVTLSSHVSQPFNFKILCDDEWYTATSNEETEGVLSSQGNLQIQVQVNSVIIGNHCKGAFLIQLDKKHTIPVTVFFDRPLRDTIHGNLIVENIDARTRYNIQNGNGEFQLYRYENLVKNGKFETEDNWVVKNKIALGIQTQLGINYVQVEGGSRKIKQHIYLKTGVTYIATAKIRNSAIYENDAIKVFSSRFTVRAYLHGDSYNVELNAPFTVDGLEGWREFREEFSVDYSGYYRVVFGRIADDSVYALDITDLGIFTDDKRTLVCTKSVSDLGTALFTNIEEGRYRLYQSGTPVGYQQELEAVEFDWPSAKVFFANTEAPVVSE